MAKFTLAGALEEFVAAAADPARWSAALEAAADATGGHGAILVPVRGKSPNLLASPSVGIAHEDYVNDGWIHRDVRYAAEPFIQSRGVATEYDFITADQIARAPFYQEFLAPHKLRWFAGVKMASGGELWCLSLQRTIAQGPFQPHEIHELAFFSKHLGGVIALSHSLSMARAEGALAAFEATDTGAVMLDRKREMILINPAAERLLGPDLTLRKRRLVSFDPRATEALDRALHDLLLRPGTLAVSPPVAMPRREGRPILAYPVRLREISTDALSPCQAIVLLIGLDQQRAISDTLLKLCFKLTAAEARLAALIGGGGDLDAACEALHIGRATARTQLKSIFAKTGVRRQSELVALFSRLIPADARLAGEQEANAAAFRQKPPP